jgi:hypothetical protein
MNDILKKLASIASLLDEKGLFEESNIIDGIIANASKKPSAKKKSTSKKKQKNKKKPVSKKDRLATKDFDRDGKIETSREEYFGSVDRAIKARMSGKK